MAFKEFKLTNDGRALHIKAANGGSITFTKVAFGNGNKPNDILSLTELVSQTAYADFVSKDDTTKNALVMKWELDSSKINNSFSWSEYGLYAKGKDGKEVLYAYSYDDTPVAITKMETGVISTYIGYVTITVADTDNINVSANDYDTVTVNQFKEHTENYANPHKVTAKDVGLGNVENVSVGEAKPAFVEANKFENINSGDTVSTLWGKVKKMFTKLSEHLSNYSNPHGVTWGQVFNKSATPLPVEQGGTGVTSLEQLKNKLEDTMLDYKSSVKFSTDIFNIYGDAFWRQNNIAFIFATFQINKELGQDDSCLICTLPDGIRPIRMICVQGQTSQQSACPSVSININTDGKVMLYSFGYENLPANTFFRFQATYPVLPLNGTVTGDYD